MTVDSQKLEDIFGAAVSQVGAAARRAYLDAACAGQPEVRARIETLLAAHESDDGFLQLPESSGLAATFDAASEQPGATIGRFKLLEQIGEGGFGVIYSAQQSTPIQRTVALKIIKPGMDTRQVIARFEAERQALAAMDHPNIARVLDAGATQNGRPYFVMELVHGVPITEFCDRERFTIRQRLELMSSVCNAVQHAHHKGIVHRDLKPSNILVAEYDGSPVPKIIDFGVAKAMRETHVDAAMFTRHDQIIGTLEYMSPEQARFSELDIDTRSDVYSLGVVLYELLTGGTPFEKQRMRSAGLDEMLRIVREEEPPPPSARIESSDSLPCIAARRQVVPTRLRRLLCGELDWIVMKALDKDPARRYPTAHALTLDLQRYLNNEPVEARPLNLAYRVKKLVRRHAAAMLASAAIAALLVGALVILVVSNARIRKEARIRDLALTAKDAALQDKDRALATAQEAVDRMLTQVANERFRDMPLSHPLRIALLEDALEFYGRLAEQAGSDPSLRRRVAHLLYTHAGLLREVGDYERAALALRQASDLLQALAATDVDAPSLLAERVGIEFDLAFTLHRGDESRLLTDDAAQSQYRRALALFDQLERQWPGRSEPPLLAHRMLAKVAIHEGNRAEALRLWRSGLSLGSAYLDRHPGNLSVRIEMGWTCVHVCDALVDEFPQSAGDVEAVLTQGIDVVGNVLADEPTSMRAADVMASMQIRVAALRCRQNRVDEALPIFARAVTGLETLCESSPWTVDYWNSLRWFHQVIAEHLTEAGRDPEVQETLDRFQQWLDRVAPHMRDQPKLLEQLQVSQAWLDDLVSSTKPSEQP